MTRTRLASVAFLIVAIGAVLAEAAPEVAPAPRPVVVLDGYRTTRTALRADPKQFTTSAPGGVTAAGYLGVLIEDRDGKPVVEAVAPESPAAEAGLKDGDVVVKIDSRTYTSAAAVRDELRTRLADDVVRLTVKRKDRTVEITATLIAASRPMSATGTGGGRPLLGVSLGGRGPDGGVRLTEVNADWPAARAGLKAGDVIVKADGRDVDGDDSLREIIATKRPGDAIDLIVERDGDRIEARPVLAPSETTGRGGRGGWDDRIPRAWRRPDYKLAILGIEYPDVKHNPKIKDRDWEESMFSLGAYTGRSATGDRVHGSMNDYFRELSYGKFKIDGKFLGWVEAKKKRMEYTTGSGTSTGEKTALLTEALDLYTKANGKDSLRDFDGIFFLYAGGRVQTTRGGLYWPHRANITYDRRRLPYFIVQEGGSRMNDISVFCHEFGHMLGLPDLYARPELPGSEGVGVWCAMSNQAGSGRPQHFSAWCKEQLDWIEPAVLDPRMKQKLILAPIEDDPTQCFKVMVRADGSEYFLLENRKKTGFDSSLPAEGLLIWRVVNGRPVLEESHGVEGASGPRVHLGSVPFPSAANTAFTPFTTPSSRSQLGGGLPVYITNIRKLPDGRVTFHIGYEYQ